MNVSNRTCIRRLSLRSMGAAKSQNLIAIFAIALTTVLFTTLFTITLSINYAMEQSNFRQVGGYAHGGFKYLTEEQADRLKDDALIRAYGLRLIVGMPQEAPFQKAHVEVSYCDANMASWMFLQPKEGRLPREGTKEAATDTRVLALLGVEPELGATFTMGFTVDGKETSETFTLCGWWDYDNGIVASHVLLPQSRAEDILKRLDARGEDGITGLWSLDMMFGSPVNIQENLDTILENHGYQNQQQGREDYIAIGVNWGYTGAQVSNAIDPATAIAFALILLLIIFTGYLIIYNVFQISVTGNIRFYGLLKTIGTTGRQMRRLIRIQALVLSCLAIPIGLLVGYFLGVRLTPVILFQLNGVVMNAVSASPLIFLLSALFSFLTVTISCHKPGNMAARVSPVEAVRYTESNGGKKGLRKAKKGASLPKMAWANLARSPKKTWITILSLSLAVVLMTLTATFTGSFDMDKYLSRRVAADFILADAAQFQVTGPMWNTDMAVDEAVIGTVLEQDGITGGGRTYGLLSSVEEFVPEAYFRNRWETWLSPEEAAQRADSARQDDGRVADAAQLYGMEPNVLDKLDLLEGDLSKLQEPGGRYLAAVYAKDDYGNPIMDSHWAQVGETVTLRYADEIEYYDLVTGAVLDEVNEETEQWGSRPKSYRDVDYEVAALVAIPYPLSYRYYGNDEFVLDDQTFIRDTGTNHIMYYAFDTQDAATSGMENYLQNLTEQALDQYDYESKETYVREFGSFRSMFAILGGVLSFIVGLVGVLNFLNAILTGILSRRREFAVLQSIGMTGRQLKTMLICEGLYYTLGSVLLSLVLCVATAPLLNSVLASIFWFFSYQFTILPILIVAPIFALLGIGLPLASYHFVAKRSVVERLREVEV